MSAYIITSMSSTLLSDEEITWLVEKHHATYNGQKKNGHDCYELVGITLPQARELIALFDIQGASTTLLELEQGPGKYEG